MLLIPRPYQVECFETFKERIDKVQRGGLIVLPTGAGKSLTMADIEEWDGTKWVVKGYPFPPKEASFTCKTTTESDESIPHCRSMVPGILH